MIPLLTIALTLLSGAADFARVFVAPEEAPAEITFYFQNRHQEESFQLLDDNGAVRPEVEKPFSYFVRCWRTNRVKRMHPRTLEVIAAISKHFGDARIEVISGFRARPYGAPHSKHFIGRAMDIHVDGVPEKVVAAWVWKNFRDVGVGYYPKQDFVHVDTRDVDVRWVDLSKHGESARAKYFARRADDPLPVDAPRLAYDAPKSTPTVAAVSPEAPASTQLALATIESILVEPQVR
jgi:uncharacterized protein YcbK (DUF882 family)